jgi:aerobic carbon-monoxide dehydrogenase large subunit
MGAKFFGARVKRLEDPALLCGRGRFVDDVKLTGVLHACFVRSPHAHARLRGIDIKPAMGNPGVHAVLTADDLPQPMCSKPMPMLLPNPAITVARTQTVLARDEVHYVGQPVAVVIADTRYLAEDAAATLIVNYDLLDAVGDCRHGMKDGAARAHSDLDSNVVAKFALGYGDIDATFADAAHVFDEVIWQHRGGGMALETRAVLASLDPGSDVLTVWSSTQTPHIGRRMLADLLEREIESIRVIAPDVGGGFGPKAIFYPEEAVIPAVALKLRRPVKWIEDRHENFLCATQERDQYWTMTIAVDANAKILGVRGRDCMTAARSCRGESSCPTSPR